jgi:hypothetical protein
MKMNLINEPITLWEDCFDCHDEKGEVAGFLQSKVINYYPIGYDFVPSSEEICGVAPCIMFEVFDRKAAEEHGVEVLRPVACLQLSKEQALLFERFFRIDYGELESLRTIIDRVKDVDAGEVFSIDDAERSVFGDENSGGT